MAQGTLDKMVERENILLAEVRWVLKVVQSRYLQHSYDNIVMKLTLSSYVSWTQNYRKDLMWQK